MDVHLQATRRRWRLRFWSMVNLAVCSVIVGQAVLLFGPQTPNVPASVIYWGEVYRRGELKIGELAPNFCLRMRDGKSEIRLTDLRRHKPVVLVFGSYTCPHFRDHIALLNKLYLTYHDTVKMFLVYTREAHPTNKGRISENEYLTPIMAPSSLEERAQIADICATALDIQMPILIDNMDDSTAKEYRASPLRVCIIDADGKFAYTGAGAGDVNDSELNSTLQSLLRP